MYNGNFLPLFPNIPSTAPLRPPLLYDIMQSMVNGGQTEKVSIHELAKKASPKIFNFKYPLSENVNKEDFEEAILNNFINRRLGYETFTLFQIKLKTKLFEIMPRYNKLFDAMKNWDLFKDGESETVESTDNRTVNNSQNISTTRDNRFSDMPENAIENVKNGSYVSQYSFDTDTGNNTNNTKDDNTHKETRKKDVSNKIDLYNQFLEQKNNIMSMIFKDLEVLFYQLISD